MFEFQFVALRDRTPGTELTAHMKNRAFSFLSDSNTNNVAVPIADKNPKKIGLVG